MSVSDPDTQRMKANRGYVQRYNAQAVVDEGQIVVAAEITNTAGDFSNLDPMICAALSELDRAGVAERPEVALADAGYWNEQHMDEVIANKHIQVLIPPDSAGRAEPRPGWTGGRYASMRTVLANHGKLVYRKRIQMIEPVFASHQAQPRHHPLRPPRPDGRAHRMAVIDGHPQPHQAPPPPPRHRRGLKPPPGPGENRAVPSDRSARPDRARRVTRRPRDVAMARSR